MAGPSIAVRVLGDVSGLAKSIQGAGKAASGAAAGLHQAFSGVLSTLNSTGVLGPFGDALAGINASVEQLGKHAKAIGPSMLAVGGAVAAAGVGLSAIGSKDQAAHQQLQASIEATGKSYDDYGKQVEEAIKHQEKFGDTANETQDALRVLTQATGDPAKALTLLNTATDLAAAKHEGLGEAATQLGKVYNGNGKLLKEFGITVTKVATFTKAADTATRQSTTADKALAVAKHNLTNLEIVDASKKKLSVGETLRLRDAQQKVRDATVVAGAAHQRMTAAVNAARTAVKNQGGAVTELGAKLHGQAAAAADTFGGKLAAVKAKVEDAAASFGQKYGPAITAAGSATAVLGGGITAVKGVLGTFAKGAKTAEDAAKGVGEAEKGAQAASSLLAGASGIGLVLLAVAALVAIGYVLYKNWDTIWGGIKAIVKVVWDWIKANWPLLLGILLGPIALAAALIYKYHKQILDGFQAVWHWIAANWPLLLAILTGPIGLAIRWIVQNWGAIVNVFNGVIIWIRGAWSTLYGTLTGTIAAAISWISGAWGSVRSAVAGVITWVEGAFQGMVGWFSGLPGRMAGLFSGMFDGIRDAFRSAVDFVINGWNSLHFSIPGFTLPFPPHTHFGGLTLGVPYIPPLAQGGLITSDGLVYAHAAEVISPAPGLGRAGPAVVIQNANFATELDVDAFMRRAAWVVRTKAV